MGGCVVDRRGGGGSALLLGFQVLGGAKGRIAHVFPTRSRTRELKQQPAPVGRGVTNNRARLQSQVECSERRQAEVNTFRFGGRIQIRACRLVRHLLFMPRLISIQGTIRAAEVDGHSFAFQTKAFAGINASTCESGAGIVEEHHLYGNVLPASLRELLIVRAHGLLKECDGIRIL